MSRPESSLIFSWMSTLKYLGISVVLMPLGYLMIHADVTLVWLLGYLIMACSVILALILPFMGGVSTAACPLCGATLEVFGKSAKYLQCEKCEEYFETTDRKVRQMDEDHVADAPRFAVRLPWWDELRGATRGTITIGDAKDYVTDRVSEAVLTRRIPDRTLSPSWPEGCCVCGSSATRTETIAQEVVLGPERMGRDRKLMVQIEGVPYCDKHRDGVQFARSPGECGRVLHFRWYAYQIQFRRANPR